MTLKLQLAEKKCYQVCTCARVPLGHLPIHEAILQARHWAAFVRRVLISAEISFPSCLPQAFPSRDLLIWDAFEAYIMVREVKNKYENDSCS